MVPLTTAQHQTFTLLCFTFSSFVHHLYNLLVSESAPPRVPHGPTGHNAVGAKKTNETWSNEASGVLM